MQICGRQQIQLHLFTALSSWQTLAHSYIHTSCVCLPYPCGTGSEISFESLPSKTAHWSTYLALYEERHDQQMQTSETRTCAYKQTFTPCAVLRSHTGSSPHVVFNRQTFLASILNYPFPRGEGTICLVIEHVAVPWYAAGMPFMCWFSIGNSRAGGCCLAVDQRVTATVCPQPGGLICW